MAYPPFIEPYWDYDGLGKEPFVNPPEQPFAFWLLYGLKIALRNIKAERLKSVNLFFHATKLKQRNRKKQVILAFL